MRGKGRKDHSGGHDERITPAYAGKRQNFDFLFFQCKDHPRLCGEKNHDHGRHRYQAGSPPPMRGKASQKVFFPHVQRITPAYAGKSSNSNTYFPAVLDHPRLCGEKAAISSLCETMKGSPPPMRGKGVPEKLDRQWYRITPAYAGKSSVFPRSSVIFEDHPRLCGEKPS